LWSDLDADLVHGISTPLLAGLDELPHVGPQQDCTQETDLVEVTLGPRGESLLQELIAFRLAA
jgi:hypothetical protein